MAQYTYDFGSAIKAGLTPDQINQYIAAQKAKGNQYQLTNTPQATPQQSQQPVQPKPNSMLDTALQFALPTAGAVLGGFVPGLGETGISEGLGAAGGQYLADKLTGQTPGADVALTGLGGAAGPVVGKVLSSVGGKALGVADKLLGKPTQDVFNSVVTKDPFMTQNTGRLATTAKDLGYMDQPMSQSMKQMPQDFKNVNDQIKQSIAKNNTPVPLATGENSLLNNFTNQLEKSAYGPGDAGYDSSVNSILNKITSLGDGSTDAATIYKEKAAMSDILSNTFTKQAKGATITPKEEANLAYFNALKDSLDQFGSEDVRALNGKQNQMYDIAKAFGSQVAKSATQGNAPFKFSSIVPEGLGAMGASAIGGNPLVGAAVGYGVQKAANSPTVMGAIGNVATKAGNIASSPVVAGVGALAGSSILPPTPSNPPTENQNNPPNQSNTLPSSPQAAFSGNNSTISGANSQALPANPNEAFQATPPAGFMKGYTVNGTPVDPATANLIWQVVNYHIDPTKMTSLRNNERERLINLASQFDPTYNSSQFNVIQKTRDDFTSGKSAQTIRSLNTAIGHLNTLAQAGQGLDNGSLPFLNSAKNAFSQGTGQPQVNRFNTAANAVAGEMAQVFKNSGATDDEIKSWKSTLDPNMSPQQLQVAINQMISLMGSRLSALQSQYSANVGKPANFSFISPESAQILQGLGIDPNTLMQQQ